jgi:hypothetical protein
VNYSLTSATDAAATMCEDAIIQSTSAAVPRPVSAKPWVLVATILASSIANIDESVISRARVGENVALPAIETDLATSIVTIQWLVNAYMLCLSALLLVGGASADHMADDDSLLLELASSPQRRFGVASLPA